MIAMPDDARLDDMADAYLPGASATWTSLIARGDNVSRLELTAPA